MAKKKTSKQTKNKYWLIHMPGIEILLNFVPNPRKISPFSKKKVKLNKT